MTPVMIRTAPVIPMAGVTLGVSGRPWPEYTAAGILSISRPDLQLEVQDNSPVLDAAAASLGTAADGMSVRAVVLTSAVTVGSAESRVLDSMLVATALEASMLVAVLVA